jgi:hypothetical protein
MTWVRLDKLPEESQKQNLFSFLADSGAGFERRCRAPLFSSFFFSAASSSLTPQRAACNAG